VFSVHLSYCISSGKDADPKLSTATRLSKSRNIRSTIQYHRRSSIIATRSSLAPRVYDSSTTGSTSTTGTTSTTNLLRGHYESPLVIAHCSLLCSRSRSCSLLAVALLCSSRTTKLYCSLLAACCRTIDTTLVDSILIVTILVDSNFDRYDFGGYDFEIFGKVRFNFGTVDTILVDTILVDTIFVSCPPK
jgi:hypothetical protein